MRQTFAISTAAAAATEDTTPIVYALVVDDPISGAATPGVPGGAREALQSTNSVRLWGTCHSDRRWFVGRSSSLCLGVVKGSTFTWDMSEYTCGLG